MASGLNLAPIPPQLKPIAHLLKTASEHETRDPVVTYWARIAALQNGLKIDKKSKESTKVLIPLMDWLEKEKKVLSGNEAITSEIVACAHVENYAMKLFEWADKEDRASKFGKNVVKAFYTAGNLFDVMQVFGELTPEVTHARKYSKWKAAYIHNCLKNGETPVPGPVGGDDSEEGVEVESTGATNAGGWAQPQMPPPVVPSQPEINIPQVPTTSQRPIVPVSEPASADTTLDPAMVTNVQKLCKHATSALDYEDVNTAIAKLTQALDILNKLKSN